MPRCPQKHTAAYNDSRKNRNTQSLSPLAKRLPRYKKKKSLTRGVLARQHRKSVIGNCSQKQLKTKFCNIKFWGHPNKRGTNKKNKIKGVLHL